MKTTTIEETISPAMAKKMLESNTNNRPINDNHVLFLSKQMKNDEFYVTGESIKFSVDGRLLDGQHRLSAIIKSGVTVKTLVTRGLDDAVFKFMDTGKTRGAGDVLAMDGVAQYNLMAGLIKYVHALKLGKFQDAAHFRNQMTNFDVSEFYLKYKDSLMESLKIAVNAKSKLMVASQLAAWHYVFKKYSLEDATEFVNRFGDGVNLAQKSAIYVLREKLMQDKINTLKLPNYHKIAFIIKAWNAYRKRKPLTRLQWDAGKEDFPKPI